MPSVDAKPDGLARHVDYRRAAYSGDPGQDSLPIDHRARIAMEQEALGSIALARVGAHNRADPAARRKRQFNGFVVGASHVVRADSSRAAYRHLSRHERRRRNPRAPRRRKISRRRAYLGR